MHWGMKMTPERPEHDPLADYFDAARNHAPVLHTELRARIIADAAGIAAPRPTPARMQSRWHWAGWAMPGLAGGAVASLVGFWIGVTQPLPVLAADVPLWLVTPLDYIDLMTVTLIGFDDPLQLEF